MNSMPAEDGPEHERRPEVGLQQHEHAGGRDEQARAEDRGQGIEPPSRCAR